MNHYIIRNYQNADFEDYVRLRHEASSMEPGEWFIPPQFVAESLSRPNYSAERDLFVVAGDDGLVGYMDITPELEIGRAVLDVWLSPEHRKKGLAAKLLASAMRRACELDVRVVQTNVGENNAVAANALSRLGFRSVRRFLELELNMKVISRQEAQRAARECRRFGTGDEEKLTCIQNRCFEGSWGYNPNTLETIAHYTSQKHFRPDDVVLAYEGDKVAGYCWTGVIPDRQKSEGRIFMLGADPDCRGRGVGRKVLLAGLARLMESGVTVAVLTVDSENETAHALYRSVGFKVRTSSRWYEKPVAQATGDI